MPTSDDAPPAPAEPIPGSAPATPAPAAAGSATPDATLHRRKWLVLLFLLVAIVLLYAFWDWNWFKGIVERRVSASTGRTFHIDGDLAVKPSFSPLISADGLHLGNVQGAKEAEMASAQRVQLRIKLWPLLQGKTVLPELHLVKPVVLLEKDAKGNVNWNFPERSGPAPEIRDFSIDHGKLTYLEPADNTNVVVGINSSVPDPKSRQAPVLLDGGGNYRGNAFTLSGRVDSPLQLENAAQPFHIDISAKAGATKAHAQGGLQNPLQLHDFDLDFAISGADLEQLYRLLGIALPQTPPYHFQGRLGHEGNVWSYRKFSGMVGDSDLGGDLSVDNGKKRSFLKADLMSKRLDFDDLGGFVGAPPQTGRGETASAKEMAQAAKLRASDRVLPDDPFNLEKIRGMDADVHLRADRLNAPKLPLQAMRTHLLLKDGVLKLDPLDFDAADGRIQSVITLDATKSIIAAKARIELRQLDLGKLLPTVKLMKTGFGRINGDIALTGRGNSIGRMMATSDGTMAFGMGNGKISNLLLEYAGLDLAEIIKFKIIGDHDVTIRCMVGDFADRNGIMTTRRFLFDTTDTLLTATGSVDLRVEQFDLRVTAKPKDHSVLALRAPLIVRGTFKYPSVKPDFKSLGVRGVIAVVLGAIAPPAAELALIEFGPGKNVDCSGAAAAAKAAPAAKAGKK